MGQYGQFGLLWIWHCAPLFFGVGVAMVFACLIISLYYNIFAAYSLVYFARCFNRILPWTLCSDFSSNEEDNCLPYWWYISSNVTTSSKEYFYKIVLNTSFTPESSIGSLKWWLLLSLLFSWVIVYIVTLRSCRSIGKFAIVMVIFCYFAILTLLVVAFQVKSTGRLVAHGTENESIFNLRMWCSAIMQVLLELGIYLGIPVVYGSYCRFRHFILIDSLILCIINYINSIIFFYLFFSFAKSFSCNVAHLPWHIPDTTIGVIYMIYSESFSTISGQHYWCLIFFLMLFLIVLGTQIAIAEAIMTAVYDNVMKLSQHRWLINLLICSVLCFLGIIFCLTNGYFTSLLLYYIPVLFIIVPLSCLFVIGIVLVYGFGQYSQNMKTMGDYNFGTVTRLFLYSLIIILFLIFTKSV